MTDNFSPSDPNEKPFDRAQDKLQTKNDKTSIRGDLWLAIRLAWDFGWIIAIPVVLFGFGGAYLDKAKDTSPLFLLLGLTLALTLSTMGILRKVREILPKK